MKIIIVSTIFLLVVEICMAKKEMNFLRYTNCPEFKNYTGIFKNIVFTKNKQGKSVSLRYQLLIKKEVKRIMITMTLKKCENSENLDSCEYYMNDFKLKNVCDMLGQNNQIWSIALTNSNFPRSCPIAAGLYKLNDTSLDRIDLAIMPIPIALWKIKFLVYDSGNNNVMVSCSDMDVKVYTTARRSS